MKITRFFWTDDLLELCPSLQKDNDHPTGATLSRLITLANNNEIILKKTKCIINPQEISN